MANQNEHLNQNEYLNTVTLGDCLATLRQLPPDSVDLLCTDPPYGYSFMGRDWDKAVPSVEVWKECLRVLKPGAFAFVMSAPRQDVLSQMVVRLGQAGFDTSFTSLYWTYASGFPKALNIGKAVDRQAGHKRAGMLRTHGKATNSGSGCYRMNDGQDTSMQRVFEDGPPVSEQAKRLEGAYGGFQPKPAVEVVIVCMKPLAQMTYVAQALSNGKGVTWLDDCRIPTRDDTSVTIEHTGAYSLDGAGSNFRYAKGVKTTGGHSKGRFPANLLVSDDVLNNGQVTHSKDGGTRGNGEAFFGKRRGCQRNAPNDSGSFSRYFDLEAWAKTLPFLLCAKASKSEKNARCGSNTHPTVKPLKLMAYLVTLGSRKGDVVLDPYAGSGSTLVSAKLLGRQFIGCELSPEYKAIAEARLAIN